MNSRDYIRSILEKYNFQKVKENSNGFISCCPFHDDSSPSFSISEEGLWTCFGCGESGNLKQLLNRLGEKTDNWRDTLKMLSINLNKSVKEKKKEETEGKLYGKELPPYFKLYKKEKECPEYLLKRINFKTISTFMLGYTKYYFLKDRIIIPVTYNWNAVGYMARATDDKILPKYFNSPGINLKKYLFNYDRCDKESDIIVLEGAFNVMSMYEKGFRNCVATLGVKVTTEQIEKILSLKPKSITICFDRDENKVGQKAAAELATTLCDFYDVYIMPLPYGKDPNQLSKEVLEVCYEKKFKFIKSKARI